MHILLESQMTWDKFINRPHYRWWSRHFCDSMRSYHELTRNCWIFLCLFLYIWTLVFEIQDGRAGISFPCLKRPRVFFLSDQSASIVVGTLYQTRIVCIYLFWTLVIEIQDGMLWRHYTVLNGHMFFFVGMTSQRLSLLEHCMRQVT